MITTNGSTVVDAPVEVVFDFLADARNEPRWLPGASNVRLTSGEPIGEGSIFMGDYARAGTVTVRLARHDRPHYISLAGDARNLSFVDEIELIATERGTSVVATMITEPKGVFRLFAPMMRKIIGQQFQANWDNLKTTLEGGSITPT
jgi:carbon monoxide dehydrogenase subunit G